MGTIFSVCKIAFLKFLLEIKLCISHKLEFVQVGYLSDMFRSLFSSQNTAVFAYDSIHIRASTHYMFNIITKQVLSGYVMNTLLI